jgi:hypothetical protein
MFLVDDLLLGPGKAAMVVFKELARKVQEDWLDDAAVKQELQEIYALAEAGKISSQEFEARECRLLERLEQIARAKFHDKWGQPEEPPVIDASVVAEPHVEETPWLLPPAPAAPPMSEPPRAPVAPVAPAASVASVASVSPVLPVTPVAPVAPVTPVAPVAPLVSSPLTMAQVVESTTRALALLNLKLSVVTSAAPEDGGWRVTAELIERRGVPDTNDLIGVYEFHLDRSGNVVRYERTRLRRRGDIGR